jgi:hypothetical protein
VFSDLLFHFLTSFGGEVRGVDESWNGFEVELPLCVSLLSKESVLLGVIFLQSKFDQVNSLQVPHEESIEG